MPLALRTANAVGGGAGCVVHLKRREVPEEERNSLRFLLVGEDKWVVPVVVAYSPGPRAPFPCGRVGVASAIAAPGGGARAPVFVAPSLAGSLSTSMASQPLLPLQETTPLLMSVVITVVITVLVVLPPPPLDSA